MIAADGKMRITDVADTKQLLRIIQYLQKGTVTLMNPADDPRETLSPGIPSFSEEIGELKAQIAELQMQVDILKETLIV